MKAAIHRDGGLSFPFGERAEVETPIKFRILNSPDAADPLNELVVASFSVGKRFGAAVTVPRTHDDLRNAEEAVTGLLQIVADHAAEIRDAIAAEREADR